jgi:hypothetical protein
MWWLLQPFLRLAAGGVERSVGRSIAKHVGAEEINNDEAFAQRINGDLHLGDFQKGMAAYQAEPAYWHKLYGDDPQFSDIHAPDAAHGGAVPPSRYYPTFPLGTGPGDTTNHVNPQGWPNIPAPQGGRRSAAPDGVSPTAFAAGGDSNTPASLFSQLMSAGQSAGLNPTSSGNTEQPAWPAAPPLQPDATDNGPTRLLVGRVYDPSQGAPFAARSALSHPSPDGSFSLNDAYLEYLKRLNANQSLDAVN